MFILKIRIPIWLKKTIINTSNAYHIKESYAEIIVNKDEGIVIDIEFDMTVRATYPISWEEDVIYTDMSNLEPGSHVAKAMSVKHLPGEDEYITFIRHASSGCGFQNR